MVLREREERKQLHFVVVSLGNGKLCFKNDNVTAYMAH